LLPLQRLAQVMHELFGCQLTPGSIVNWQQEAAAAVQPTVDSIKTALGKVRVLHCDETGLYVGGQRHWLHLHATAR
jgi:transposase